MTDVTPDLSVYGSGSGQWFPRFRYESSANSETLNFESDDEVVDGYRRFDNITDEALAGFTKAYPDLTVSKDDIFFYVYGLLHSTEYRETYGLSSDIRLSA